MTKANTDVRSHLKQSDIFIWEVAKELGIHESSLYRLLRTEMTNEQKQQIIDVVTKIQKERSV
ncbi:hypothetical protein ORD22_08170 [Sporosarcina sp. GW1-11]|uniref:hypothetical protein n=1 Tax=Sporosarcina sp. GW1-11 TaxID=2899126 RepID=UPI00294E1816|nr:hypothetical protein [Sporosarcina sp. GW1-11]MDV6378222.1 hypothetical protein [Sporosarcina sp. GW1-11]